MKKFETPALELEELEIADVITASNDDDLCLLDGLDCDNDLH